MAKLALCALWLGDRVGHGSQNRMYIREQLQDEVGIVLTTFEAIRFLGDTVKIQNRMFKNIGGTTAALGGGRVVALTEIALAVVPAIADVSHVDPG